MPAMPIAESSAPIVVGISATSSEISVVSEIGVCANSPNGRSVDDDDHEDQGQPGEQDVERDLVRCLAPRGALDERDHAVEEGVTGLLGDLDDDLVGEHARAAGDGAAVAAGLADHRGRLAGDGRLVDRGDALDHRAVARDQLAGLDDDDVALGAARRRAWWCRPASLATVSWRIARSVSACARPRPSANASAMLANTTVSHSQKEIVNVYQAGSWPPPSGLPPNDLDQPRDGRDHGADLDHEHHRVADLDAGIELDDALDHAPGARCRGGTATRPGARAERPAGWRLGVWRLISGLRRSGGRGRG